MPSEISIPFRVTSDGTIAKTDDPDAQVRLHVLALVNTNPVERVTVPGYGVNLTGLLFEDAMAEDIAASVSVSVRDQMSAWEPGVRLDSVEIDETRTEDETSALNVLYSRKDAADSGTSANVNTVIIGANGTVRETVRG